jgi:hypothetical protein
MEHHVAVQEHSQACVLRNLVGNEKIHRVRLHQNGQHAKSDTMTQCAETERKWRNTVTRLQLALMAYWAL